MKKSFFTLKGIFPFITLITLSAFLLISCAHQETASVGNPEVGLDDLSDSPSFAQSEESSPTDSEASSGQDDDAFSLPEFATGDNAPPPDVESGSPGSSSFLNEDSEGTLVSENQDVTSEQTEFSTTANDALDSLSSIEEQTKTSERGASEAPSPPSETTLAKNKPIPQAKRTVASVSPTLPRAPIERNGELLNRFYFLRDNDTPESVSKIIYGNSEKAEALKSWNSSTQWKAGSAIFFISPLQPADGNMRSFYEERGMSVEDYIVKKGDHLSSIALDNYGSINSWKEIGVLNKMGNPDSLTPGTKIALLPSDFSEYSLESSGTYAKPTTVKQEMPKPDSEINRLESEISQLEKEINQQMDTGSGVTQKTTGSLPQVEEPFQNEKPLVPGKTEKKDQQPKLASFDLNQFIRQNIFYILLGILGLAIALFYVFTRKPKHYDGGIEF